LKFGKDYAAVFDSTMRVSGSWIPLPVNK
jgi:hypothetical protein